MKTLVLEKVSNANGGKMAVGEHYDWTYLHHTRDQALRSVWNILKKVYHEDPLDWKVVEG